MVGLAAWVLKGFRVCGLSILKMVPVLIAYVLILRQSTRMAVMVSASVSPSAASTQVVPNRGKRKYGSGGGNRRVVRGCPTNQHQ